MNILIVTQYFHPEPFRISDLALELCHRGHAVTVLTGTPNYPEGSVYPGYPKFSIRRESYGGVAVVRVPLIPRGKHKNWRLILNYLSFAIAACVLGPLCCRQSADVILVFEPSPVTVGLPGLLMGKLKKAPVMFWIQDLWPETLAAMGQHGLLARAGGWIAAFIHSRCDQLLVQSQAFVAPLLQRGIAHAQIRYLPNWAGDFYRQDHATTNASPLGRFAGIKIVFAGNIGSAQSFETILDAADRLRARQDIHWIIVGDGLMREWVATQVHTKGLQSTVILLDRFPPESMPAIFSEADALLVTLRPDPVFAMTIPGKTQSYLAAGKAIIAALNGEGARVIAEAGAGFVARAGDGEALARCVQQIAALTPEERAAMGRRGRDYFDRYFSRGQLITQLESWMQELIKGTHAYPDTRR